MVQILKVHKVSAEFTVTPPDACCIHIKASHVQKYQLRGIEEL
jgi:hypothetical protein